MTSGIRSLYLIENWTVNVCRQKRYEREIKPRLCRRRQRQRHHYNRSANTLCLDGLAPSYLACEFHRVADTESRQRLRSASTAELIILRVRCATIGGRAFPVTAAHVWNTLPSSVTSSSSLAVFKSRLKQNCSSDATVLSNIDTFSTFIMRFY